MCAYGGYPPVERANTGWRGLLIAQGTYFLVSGVWPLVWMDGFLAVTGPKNDLWLVRTVGLLAAVIGLVLVTAGLRRTYVAEVVVLAVTSALAFLVVDVVGWTEGVLRWTYLLDAAIQALVVAAWVLLAGTRWARGREP